MLASNDLLKYYSTLSTNSLLEESNISLFLYSSRTQQAETVVFVVGGGG